MAIQYVCVGCGEEHFLPDSKAGCLLSCMRCRLKFVAPPPNVAAAPGAAASAPGTGSGSRPGTGSGSHPGSASAATARSDGRPPLYPLDETPGAAASRAARREPGAPARGVPKTAGLEESGDRLFGLSSRQAGSKLFGEEADQVEVGELFAETIPSKPDVDEDLDVPLPPGQATPALAEPELAVPPDEQRPLDETDRESADVPSPVEPRSVPPAGQGDLISMHELFAREPAPAPASPPPFGRGPLPTPFLKPVAAPVPSGPPLVPSSGSASGSGPFTLVSVEGIPDAKFELRGGGNYLIGRDKDAEVKILSNSVSRKHARIDATGQEPILIDLGSANGTQVNGSSINRHALRDGDVIKVGKVVLRFKR